MKRIILCAILFLASADCMFADGGRLRFSRTAGPFLVTLFTTPEPLTPGTVDFSVMVQDAKSGDILQDAQVTLDLTEADTTGDEIHAVASHGIAANRLLQAAEFDLPKSGVWRIHVNVDQGARSAALDESIVVDAGSRKAPLVWIFGLLPVLAIALFILQQRQKSYLAQRHATVTARKI